MTNSRTTAYCTLALALACALPMAPVVSAADDHISPFARVFAGGPAAPSHTAQTTSVRIAVVARDTKFIPSVLYVKAGSKIQIHLRNEGKKDPHNITFRTLPYHSASIPPGKTTTLDMVAPTPGNYAFVCTIEDHASHGMTGTLVVTP